MFTVFHIAEDGWEARGLSLSEAFARVMAFAERGYSFEQAAGETTLHLKRKTPLPPMPFPDPELDRYFNPIFRSAHVDPAAARAEIMAAVIRAGLDGYTALPDEQFDEIAA